MKKKNILLLVSGSVAAFKAAEVCSKLIQKDHAVEVISTKSALQFVGKATWEGLTGRPVRVSTFQETRMMDHIHLVKWADLALLCPATGNQINKLALGITEDLVGCLSLAWDFEKPFLIFPAMNPLMFAHPSVQTSLQKLQAWGHQVISPSSGRMACGDEGAGRLPEVPEILKKVEFHLTEEAPESQENLEPGPFQDKKIRVLITGGGTTEPIDGVRSLTNRSSGRTASFIADHLARTGLEVTYLSAKSSPIRPGKIDHIFDFVTTEDLSQLLSKVLEENYFHVIIHAAAVSDFKVGQISQGENSFAPNAELKISSHEEIKLHLVKNPKLVSQISQSLEKNQTKFPQKKTLLIAFKLTQNANETEIINQVRRLMKTSKIDLVIHNDLAGIDSSGLKHDFRIFDNSEELARGKNLEELARKLQSAILSWTEEELSLKTTPLKPDQKEPDFIL